LVPDLLRDQLRLVRRDPLHDRPGHLVDLPRHRRLPHLERLQRDAPLDQLLLEHLDRRPAPLLSLRLDRDGLFPRPAHRRPRPPQVEPRGQLLPSLVQRVVHLLPVDLAHHVERRVRHLPTPPHPQANTARHATRPATRLPPTRFHPPPPIG